MGKKRKRPVKGDRPCDHLSKPGSPSTQRDDPGHSHPVISLYYPQVVTLRQFLLQQIPVSSKARRRRIAAVRNNPASPNGGNPELSTFLDTTLVGILKESPPTCIQNSEKSWVKLTQSRAASQVRSTDTGASSAQEEIVNFAIQALLNRSKSAGPISHHPLLIHGLRPGSHRTGGAPCSIPGYVEVFPNRNAQALKQAPWTDVLDLLGCNGEEIMLRLLLNCGIFTAVDCQKGVYYQVSGLPLSALEPAQKQTPQMHPNYSTTERQIKKLKPVSSRDVQCKASNIVFFRRRMLYAHPTLGQKGRIQYGLTDGHVLNRFGHSDSLAHTVHVMKYVFPKQFKLENVFTPKPNSSDGDLRFKDWTSREEEIAKRESSHRIKFQHPGISLACNRQDQSLWIPKRLRGKPVELVQQLQTRHNHCSYVQLLQYYCPVQSLGPWKLSSTDAQNELLQDPKSSGSENLITQARDYDLALTPTAAQTNSELKLDAPMPQTHSSKPKTNLTEYATPSSSVSAFCRAVLRKLISPQWFGVGQQGKVNQRIVFWHVDQFVRMRRLESLSIHGISKGIKITSIPWLEPPNSNDQRNKLSLSDLQKRTELLHEFLYYIFDSVLIPLIRSSFYVTESQSHRNRLFYFRHDVWRRLTEKPLADLKSSTFDQITPKRVASISSRTTLGYGSLRLLPKATGTRPLLNLSRRMLVSNSTKAYASSVNNAVSPIYHMLNYEITRKPAQLGSCMKHIGEIHARLKVFKENRVSQTLPGRSNPSRLPFYFVRLDVQSSFDTIPQAKLIDLVQKIVPEERYYVSNHWEVRPSDEFSGMWPSHMSLSRQGKGRRKWVGNANPGTKLESLGETIANGGGSRRRNTVFVGTAKQMPHDTKGLLGLLADHLQDNVVKFRGKYFRQRNGIPQGSVLSTLLCNLFYAEMERDILGFLDSEDALLVRLIDDFLLVTSDSTLALKFLTTMIKGQPEYGVTVNPSKSLVNFAAAVEGTHVPRLVDTSLFPYCGVLIDTRTLEVHKDHDKMLEGGDTAAATLSNSLTVESSKTPGRSLHQKTLESFKMVMHPMYLDTKHNSLTVVLSNLYANFITTAMKMYRYMRALRGRNHPTPEVVIRIIRNLTELASRIVELRRDPEQPSGSTADLSSSTTSVIHRSQLAYLAAAAFRYVFGRKQTRYGAVLLWLDQVYKENRLKAGGRSTRLAQVIRKGNLLYGSWRF